MTTAQIKSLDSKSLEAYAKSIGIFTAGLSDSEIINAIISRSNTPAYNDSTMGRWAR